MSYNPQRNSSNEFVEAVPRTSSRKKFLIVFLVFGVLLMGAAVVLILTFSLLSSKGNFKPPPPPGNHLPEFPWPPKASAYTKVPQQYLLRPQGETVLKDVAARLEFALRSAGYSQTSYYAVPGGFALVSQLEQFKPDGLPVNDRYRWSEEVEVPQVFSLEYLSDLIKGKIGRYRVIVFAISDDFFSQESGKEVSIEQARTIAIKGANMLPDEVSHLPYTDRHTCTALVYEFEKLHADEPAEFKDNSTLMAEKHIQKILPYLQR